MNQGIKGGVRDGLTMEGASSDLEVRCLRGIDQGGKELEEPIRTGDLRGF